MPIIWQGKIILRKMFSFLFSISPFSQETSNAIRLFCCVCKCKGWTISFHIYFTLSAIYLFSCLNTFSTFSTVYLMRYFLPNWIRRKIITHHKSNVPAHTLIVCRWVKNEAKESAQRCRRITNYRFQLQFTYHFFVIHHLSPVIDRCRRLFVTTCFPHTHKQHNTKRIANGTALKCATHHFLQCKTRSREKKMPNEQWQNAKKPLHAAVDGSFQRRIGTFDVLASITLSLPTK